MMGRSSALVAGVVHATAFAYLMLLTRDRPDWTIGVFFKYATLLRAGQVPYRDFVLEYPPLAVPLIWLPRLVAPTLVAYRAAFAWQIVAVDLLGVGVALWAIARVAPQVGPWGVVLAQPLWLIWAGRSLIFDRFDLAPAVLVLLALVLVAVRRERWAWAVLGLATALKLYPLVVVPLMALAAWRHRTRWQAATDGAAFVAALVVPSLIVTHGDLGAITAFLKYHLDRGLEIETVYAAVLMLGRFTGAPVSQMWGHGGNEIVAPLAPLLAALTGPVTALLLTGIYVTAWRTSRRWGDASLCFHDLVRLSAAAVLAFMVAGKVLSPQYMLWLFPLVPLLRQRALLAWSVYGVVLLLSNWIFPEHYYLLVLFQAREIGVLLVRNALLLLLGAILLVPPVTVSPHASGLQRRAARATRDGARPG